MRIKSYRRHDISNRVWKKIATYLPGRQGTVGRPASDNRAFINGVIWILRTGAPWRDLPDCYGKWSTVQRRFCRWRDKGVWEKLLNEIIEEPDYEWLMIDASHVKVHPHASGSKTGNQDMDRTKGGSIARYIWPWMRLVIRFEPLLLRVPQLIAHRLKP